ncbi:MAG: DUF1264 domain-containing protein [Candidatus Baltobacteraceae bacterium]
MAKYLIAFGLVLAFVAGAAADRYRPLSAAAAAATTSPTDGWTLHIDAEKHFGDAHPTEIAHHWCKNVAGGLVECQIYDSDAPDAHLVAVETVVAPAVYNSFPPAEQALWHYHKVEIPKVNATLPGMTPEEAAKALAAMSDTYGKVWLLWDPMVSVNPIGEPTVSILK